VKSFSVRPLTGLAEKIYMMLYMEESKGLDGPRRYLQYGSCAVTCFITCTSWSSKRLPKYPLPTFSLYKIFKLFHENSSI
jgi:hypothetical protein